MRANFGKDGTLYLIPQTELEAWALRAWDEQATRTGEGYKVVVSYNPELVTEAEKRNA